ncbi:MAG: thiamine pyrophosphate-dependent dehydrogenase E1 component subunit alpha [Gammaproteobacteria bacterium]|nr:thiamine pyrophosphate-dependent dehydrogenase E1 component subunit alpha [Gammaproteobacteria bacterium]
MSAPTSARNLDTAHLRDQLRLMYRIRAFETAAVAALEEKLVLGAIHPSFGQEAAAVGVVGSLRRDDLLLSTHRGHGHTLVKGASPLAMMRELFGREGGCCDGKGGSMHIADFEVGMLGANGVVGANIVIAAGAAHAVKLKGEDKVVCCIFGDGAINRGPFLEGLNWAKVFDLPVLFVCEDNRFAATTRSDAMTGGEGAAARAAGIGLTVATVDGNDLVEVEAAARSAIEAIRGGGGPRLLHVKTYRLGGHTGVDPAAYRDAGEVAAQREDDPIGRLRALLETAGVPAADLDALEQAAREEMEEVYAAARDTAFPALARAFTDVQDVGGPDLRPY